MAVLLLVPGSRSDDALARLIHALDSSGFKIVVAGEHPPSPLCQCQFVELDLRGDEASIDRSISRVRDVFGRIDALVFFCDHEERFNPVLDVTEQEFDGAVQRNLKAAWMVSRSVVRRMKDAGDGGSIVFVTSIAGNDRGLFPGTSVYSACVAAVHQLSKTMAMELGKLNIRVNCIVRGWSESDAAAMISSNFAGSQTAMASASSVSKVLPLERWVDDFRDLAPSLLFYAGKYSSFLTGTTIAVDGGQSLVRPRLKSRF